MKLTSKNTLHPSWKDIAVRILYFLLCSLLCACEQGPAPAIPDGHSGTRMDPYTLGEEIVLHTSTPSNSHCVDYTLRFTSVWESERVKREYPAYSVSGRPLVRGTLSVDSEGTVTDLPFALTPYFALSGKDEALAHFESYENGVLNNSLARVLDGDQYDIIVLKNERSHDAALPAFLKIVYTDAEGRAACVWVDLAEADG